MEFDPGGLKRVMTAKDRYHRNIGDEVESIGEVHDLEPSFMPSLLAVTSASPCYWFRLVVAPFIEYEEVGGAVGELLPQEQEFPAQVALEWQQKDELPCGASDLRLMSDGNLSVKIPAGGSCRTPTGR